MIDYRKFEMLSPTFFADFLPIEQVMESHLSPLWHTITRIAGPAFTVSCAPADNLMLHAAIYRAAPGSIIVVQAGDARFAVSGGNVCAIAQQRGIAGFIVDGVVRDLEEIRESRFPVFARGISPKPGSKRGPGTLNEPIICGGVRVEPGDIMVADEEGIVVIPRDKQGEMLQAATDKAHREEAQSLEQWTRSHRAKIDQILSEQGYTLNS